MVLTHAQPAAGDLGYSLLPGERLHSTYLSDLAYIRSDVKQDLLEKPRNKEDQGRMLLDLNGNVCEVVTGVVIGTHNSLRISRARSRSISIPHFDLPGLQHEVSHDSKICCCRDLAYQLTPEQLTNAR